MWGQIIGSVIGAVAGDRRAKAAERERLEDKMYMRGRGSEYLNMARDQLDRDRYLQDLQIKQDQMNTRLSLEDRDYLRRRVSREDVILDSERRQRQDRQYKVDQSAASERMWQIQQMLKNQNLAKAERSFAEGELRRLQGQYGLERQEDINELRKYQGALKRERAFDVSQLTRGQQIADAERKMGLSLRNQLMQRSGRYADEMEYQRTQLGPARRALAFGPGDVERAAERRRGQTGESFRRAVMEQSSGQLADVMRRGMFSPADRPGSVAEDTLARVVKNAASMYDQQYNESYDWAMKYITGHQGMSQQAQEADLARRNALLGETATTFGSPLTPYLQAAQQTAVGSGQYDRPVGSAAHRGQTVSGTGWQNYQLPSALTSEWGNVGQGLGRTQDLGSAVGGWRTPGAGTYDTSRMTAGGINSLLGGASTLFGGGDTRAGQAASDARSNAFDAGKGLGRTFDNWWQGRSSQNRTRWHDPIANKYKYYGG